jgi:hypothetical protein
MGPRPQLGRAVGSSSILLAKVGVCLTEKEARNRHPDFTPDSLVCPLVWGPLHYPSARAATSSRQKAGISGTMRPQTR